MDIVYTYRTVLLYTCLRTPSHSLMHRMNSFIWTHQGEHVTQELALDTFHNGCNRKITNVRKQKTPLGVLDIQKLPKLLLCYDIETTGLSHMKDAITQISIQCIVQKWDDTTEEYDYETIDTITSFVHTTQVVSPFITRLTGITQDNVDTAPSFAVTANRLQVCIDKCCQSHNIYHCFWVAHNGFGFDHLFLAKYVHEHTPADAFWLRSILGKRRFWCVDTLPMSKQFTYAEFQTGAKPQNYKLQTLYAFFLKHCTPAEDTPRLQLQFHRADEDVTAMVYVLQQMHNYQPHVLLSSVSYDTYFHDAVRPHQMVNRVDFNTLQGVHGKTIEWTTQQERVLNAPFDEHICIIAGAGCAKTTTLLGRILCLLRNGVQPHKITLVAFSKDATEDMAARLTQWVGTEVPIRVGTFDALSRKYLKDNDSDAFEACQDVGSYKHQFLSFLQHSRSPQRLDVLRSMDYLFVDEYQDINTTYHDIISLFAKHGTIVTGVGDDAQNIYSWNGADMQYILEFGEAFHNDDAMSTLPRRPVHTYYLTHNFRSTPEILDVANASIARNTCQLPKTILPTVDSVCEGVQIYAHHNWQQEVSTILPMLKEHLQNGKSVAVLCRNCTRNGPLYFYESELTKVNIPHSLLERYRDHRNHAEPGVVTLCTIHKSKGLEWDVVVVVGCNDTYFPSLDNSVLQQDETSIETALTEERRLFYVATTRAKTTLLYTFSCEQTGGHPTQKHITRFLTELPRTLFQWNNVPPAMLCSAPSTYKSAVPRMRSFHKVLDTVVDAHWKQLYDYVSLHADWETLCTHSKIHTTFELPSWIKQHHMYEDIERWMEHMLIRMHSSPEGMPHTLPLMDGILHRVCVSAKEFRLYTKYQSLFRDFLEDQVTDIVVEQADMCAFHTLFEKCKNASTLYMKSLSSLHVSTNTNVPRDIKQRLAHAYTQWKDTAREWATLLWESFELSWCEAIENGRMRCVHQQLEHGKTHIVTLTPLVETMYAALVTSDAVCEPLRNLHLQTTVTFENMRESIPLVLESHTSQYTVFTISLADKIMSNPNDILTCVLKSCLIHCSQNCPTNPNPTQMFTSIHKVQYYYPHLGVLQTIHLDRIGMPLDTLWEEWKRITNGKASMLVPTTFPSTKRLVLETEKWEDCCIDEDDIVSGTEQIVLG